MDRDRISTWVCQGAVWIAGQGLMDTGLNRVTGLGLEPRVKGHVGWAGVLLAVRRKLIRSGTRRMEGLLHLGAGLCASYRAGG